MTYNIDAIKRAARRSAWYPSDDEPTTFNPYGRFGARQRKQRDVENGARDGGILEHISTENNAVSPIEANRRSQYDAEKAESGAPKRAGTYPGGSSIEPYRESYEDGNLRSPTSLEKDEKAHSGISGSTVAPTDVPPASSTEQSVGTEGTRKRKARKFHIPIPFKKNKEEERGIERAETTESQRKKHPKLTVMSQFKAVFFSWINILLIAVPVGIALEYTGTNKIVVL